MEKIQTSNTTIEPDDLLVSSQEIVSSLRVRDTIESYVYVYQPKTGFTHAFGQMVVPGERKYVLFGPKQPHYLVEVKKKLK